MNTLKAILIHQRNGLLKESDFGCGPGQYMPTPEVRTRFHKTLQDSRNQQYPIHSRNAQFRLSQYYLRILQRRKAKP